MRPSLALLVLLLHRAVICAGIEPGTSLFPLCCAPGVRITANKCQGTIPNGTLRFPPIFRSNDFHPIGDPEPGLENKHFVWDPCENAPRYKLNPREFPEDAFLLLDNRSVYLQTPPRMLGPRAYCLGATVPDENEQEDDRYTVVLCFDSPEDEGQSGESRQDDGRAPVSVPVGMIISVPFLLATLLVYTIVPELRNMHGLTLRGYVGPLVIAYTMLVVIQVTPEELISTQLCIAIAFIIHFSFLASFFWLNVMCFDIWWTFGGFRSLQGSVKQREKKKFLMYSIYAWGCATTLTVICAIMDYAPSVPDHFIKPGFGSDSCWFKSNVAKAIYFYGPMGVTVFCNICLFISTALKIVRHKKDTAHQLKGSESRRHDDNKQWFNLYLKLFIVMGINWSMEIISWLLNDTPGYLWYITDLMNTLQGLIIFIIFVWKDKIKRLLLRRFGCQGRNVLSRNSTRSACNSSSSRTCTTLAPLQEKSNPFVDSIQRPKPSYDESDGV